MQCEKHLLPLIKSCDRSKRCNCGRKEYLTCCELNCKTVLCKMCFESKDQNIVSYVSIELEDDHALDDNSSVDSFSANSNSSILSDEINEFDLNEHLSSNDNTQSESHIIDEDNFGDFLTSAIDLDFSMNEENDTYNDNNVA